MRPIIYKLFRYAGAGLDEISIHVLFPFKLLKPGFFWLVGHKVAQRIIPEPLGVLLQNLVIFKTKVSIYINFSEIKNINSTKNLKFIVLGLEKKICSKK